MTAGERVSTPFLAQHPFPREWVKSLFRSGFALSKNYLWCRCPACTVQQSSCSELTEPVQSGIRPSCQEGHNFGEGEGYRETLAKLVRILSSRDRLYRRSRLLQARKGAWYSISKPRLRVGGDRNARKLPIACLASDALLDEQHRPGRLRCLRHHRARWCLCIESKTALALSSHWREITRSSSRMVL